MENLKIVGYAKLINLAVDRGTRNLGVNLCDEQDKMQKTTKI